MLKKLVSGILVVFMVASIACTAAFAMTDEEKALKEVEKANIKIEKSIQKAIEKGEKMSDKDIQKLIEKTNGAAIKGIIKAQKYGVEVECEYVMVEINGEIVLIDPLRVIRA